MRVLLCIALVALLATPSLAGPPKGQQPPKGKYPPKPKPWRAVTGKVLADSKGIDFARQPFAWIPDDVDTGKVNIVSSLNGTKMDWQVVGDAYETEADGVYNLANVTWAYGAVVKAVTEDVLNADDEIVDSKLTVTLYGDKVQVIKPGRTLNLGPLVSITYKARPFHPREVEIVVKPFIKIVVTQPYVRPPKGSPRWVKGRYASFVTAAVTLTAEPKNELTGLLVPVAL